MRRPCRLLTTLLGLLLLFGATLTLPATSAAQQSEVVNRDVVATRDGWLDTGISLAAGETAHIVASGNASWDGGQSGSGPDGSSIEWCRPVVPELPVGALLARVDADRPVLANGAQVKGPGSLALAYNDCPGQYFDNTGTFAATLHVMRLALPVIDAPQVPSPSVDDARTESEGGLPVLPLAGGLAALLLGVGAIVLWRRFATGLPRFDPSAQVRSSAWLTPVSLRDLQGGRWPKRSITVGGPDADIDFGVPGNPARLVPTDDGGARIEPVGGDRVLVNDMPVILGQRLGPGSRVRIGSREFTYTEDRRPPAPPVGGEQPTVLDKPDPRAA